MTFVSDPSYPRKGTSYVATIYFTSERDEATLVREISNLHFPLGINITDVHVEDVLEEPETNRK